LLYSLSALPRLKRRRVVATIPAKPKTGGFVRQVSIALGLLMLAVSTVPAHAIPAFARKYRVSCAMCHAPAPRLNDMGELFAANGFEIVRGEKAPDTITTGDPLLQLQRDIPLAVRVDTYLQALTKRAPGESQSDLQLPWVVKLLSGGQVADNVSYYMYFLLSERGEVAGLEDAYVQFTDIASSGVSVIAGQFQVSDPLFKRELRLQYEDYQPYRVRVGETAADLTYDRGLMAMWSPRGGTDVTVQLVNGRGLNTGSSSRQYDRDAFKNVGLRVSQDAGPLRVGGFGYFGRERSEDITNTIRIYGPDATLKLGSIGELNLQLLRRTDSNPFFVSGPSGSTVDAAMAELVYWPQGWNGRWFFAGLYNYIDANRPVVSLRLGEQETDVGYLERYHTASLGAHYLLKRNVRLLGEAGWDFELDHARFVTGFTLAF
jgi:hypothetical protein